MLTIRSRTQIFHFKKQEEKLIHQLEQAGLVKKKATLLAQFSQSRAEAEKLVNQASFWTLVDESERMLTWLVANKKESYLQVAKLASLADDKEKQDSTPIWAPRRLPALSTVAQLWSKTLM